MTFFNIGSRHYAGRSIALLSLTLIIARAILLYTIRKVDEEENRAEEKSPTVPIKRREVK